MPKYPNVKMVSLLSEVAKAEISREEIKTGISWFPRGKRLELYGCNVP